MLTSTIISLAISFLALFFSIYTFLTHDRKLKIQQKKLNEYELILKGKEADESKKANN